MPEKVFFWASAWSHNWPIGQPTDLKYCLCWYNLYPKYQVYTTKIEKQVRFWKYLIFQGFWRFSERRQHTTGWRRSFWLGFALVFPQKCVSEWQTWSKIEKSVGLQTSGLGPGPRGWRSRGCGQNQENARKYGCCINNSSGLASNCITVHKAGLKQMIS